MHTRIVRLAITLIAVLPAVAGAQGTGHLRSFESRRELERYLARVAPPPPRHAAAPTSPSCSGTSSIHRSRSASGAAVVTGTVRGKGGDAIEGAQLFAQGTGIGAVTNAAGSYRLVVPADSLPSRRRLVLVARRIGYASHEVTMRIGRGTRVQVDLALCASATMLATQSVSLEESGHASAAADASITNTQHAGVDEGGIVKRAGNFLVVLRRGRLFTIDISRGRLQPVETVNAYGAGIDPRGTWYDELLVDSDRVVVIGYSYARGGTEIGIFRLSHDGALRHEDTYQLRSNDYYSSRNYASRLIGSTLVYYTPLYVSNDGDLSDALPAMRRWSRVRGGGAFREIASPGDFYRPPVGPRAGEGASLHTVTRCDLAQRPIACRATVLVGPWSRVFYASRTAMYLWTGTHAGTGDEATLYRVPLDGGAPSALVVHGAPIDQFSFLESDDAHLNVLVRDETGGDAMWLAERPHDAAGGGALLRVPLASFGDGRGAAPRSAYRAAPMPAGGSMHNRFVGDYALYGSGNGWGWTATAGDTLFAMPWRRGGVARIPLPHPVDRIEAMGRDAVVVGASDADLHVTGIVLDAAPHAAHRYTLEDAAQGETRSHGFFYRPDSAGGTIGLPIRGGGSAGWRHLVEGSAGVLFLRNDAAGFAELGVLAAREGAGEPGEAPTDGCVASCVDWYGNARPIFTDGRTFALLGYELVEGRVRGGRLEEFARASFAPRAINAVRR